jgi:hypothetical protein
MFIPTQVKSNRSEAEVNIIIFLEIHSDLV